MYLGPGLYISIYLCPRPCSTFADVTLADDDTNSILADGFNTMTILRYKQYMDQQVDKVWTRRSIRVSTRQGGAVVV